MASKNLPRVRFSFWQVAWIARRSSSAHIHCQVIGPAKWYPSGSCTTRWMSSSAKNRRRRSQSEKRGRIRREREVEEGLGGEGVLNCSGGQVWRRGRTLALRPPRAASRAGVAEDEAKTPPVTARKKVRWFSETKTSKKKVKHLILFLREITGNSCLVR